MHGNLTIKEMSPHAFVIITFDFVRALTTKNASCVPPSLCAS